MRIHCVVAGRCNSMFFHILVLCLCLKRKIEVIRKGRNGVCVSVLYMAVKVLKFRHRYLAISGSSPSLRYASGTVGTSVDYSE